MEAAALNAPPAWLERIVLLAIPPAAREAVAGDLWETYSSPRQYAAEALRTVPLVIASQMRRNLNLPTLMLQGGLAFTCLGGTAALALLPVLMLLGAYRATARPCPRRAMRESILMASGITVLLLAIMSIHLPARASLDHFTWLSLFLQALLLSPLLCIFRAGLILQGDSRPATASSDLQMEDLQQMYHDFMRRALRRNLLEAGALALAAACGVHFSWNVLLTGLFALVAFHLLLHAAPRALPQAADFVSLRAQYQQELTRQQQLRHFLWWLWFAPALIALNAGPIHASMAAGRPVLAVLGGVGAVLLCFMVTALNREQHGRVREQIGLLDRTRQRMIAG
jgi:hypothetical protein